MIIHGIPNHPFFYIIQPPSAQLYSERVQPQNPGFVKPVLDFKDPRTGQTWKAELWDVLRIDLYRIPDHMCRAAYGANSNAVVPMLEQRYPEVRTKKEIEFLQLKKL
jgi:hypothetical protein